MGAISLRRMKDLVGLPPKTVMTCYVDFSSEERERYDLLENEARSTVRSLVEEDNLMINYSTVLHILLRLRQICNDASLCPPNIASLFSSNALQGKFQYIFYCTLSHSNQFFSKIPCKHVIIFMDILKSHT